MRLLLSFVLWMVFFLSTPMIIHVCFSSREYPLVSIGAVIGFAGGALLSALITGLFRDAGRHDQSSPPRPALTPTKGRRGFRPSPAARARTSQNFIIEHTPITLAFGIGEAPVGSRGFGTFPPG